MRGRFLDATDRAGGLESVVLSAAFARRLFGDKDPIGQQMRFGPAIGRDAPWRTVVGVVGDVRQYSLALGAPDAFYVVAGQWDWVDRTATLVVQSTEESAALLPALQRAIWQVNPNVPIPRIETMSGYVQASASDRRFVLLAIGTFAIAALLLAAVGLYGVISGERDGTIPRNRHPDGAGGDAGQHHRPGGEGGPRPGARGCGIGLVGAVVVTRLINSMLFGVSALDPLTYGVVVGLLTVVAALAAWAPARRASSVDPVIALREE